MFLYFSFKCISLRDRQIMPTIPGYLMNTINKSNNQMIYQSHHMFNLLCLYKLIKVKPKFASNPELQHMKWLVYTESFSKRTL